MSTSAYNIGEGYPLPDFNAAWRYFRVWSRRMWLLTLGWVPVAVFLAITLSTLYPKAGIEHWTWAFVPVMVLYSIATTIAIVRVFGFRCPRCGARFYSSQRVSFFDFSGITFGFFGPLGPRYRLEAKACPNCGLRGGSMGDEVKVSSEDDGIVIRPRHDQNNNG